MRPKEKNRGGKKVNSDRRDQKRLSATSATKGKLAATEEKVSPSSATKGRLTATDATEEQENATNVTE